MQSTRTCSVQDCFNKVLSRGYCGKHYQRWYKYGNTSTVGVRKPTPVDANGIPYRLWAKVNKSAPGGCWEWQGGRYFSRYGRAWVDGKNVNTHRFFYERLIGKIPEGLQLDHLCRNILCCNPAHLEPVTLGVNVLRGIGITAVNKSKTHCKWGHAFDEFNTGRENLGDRFCITCKREQQRARRARHARSKANEDF